MNRNLLVFSLLLVVLGLGLGTYLLSFFGLLLLIPSLLPSSRPAVRPAPAPAPYRQQPRRITPPPFQPQQAAAPTFEPKTEAMAPQAPPTRTYSAALFPGPLLSPISQIGTYVQASKDVQQQKQGERDELLEVGAILALIRLALG